MPCVAPVRGKTDTQLPWSDLINNDPCGKAVVLQSGGAVDWSTRNLCLAHLIAAEGARYIYGPITYGA